MAVLELRTCKKRSAAWWGVKVNRRKIPMSLTESVLTHFKAVKRQKDAAPQVRSDAIANPPIIWII